MCHTLQQSFHNYLPDVPDVSKLNKLTFILGFTWELFLKLTKWKLTQE